MARGFLSGAIWATVLSVAGLGTVSVMSPKAPRMQPVPSDAALPGTQAPEPEAAPETVAQAEEPAASEAVPEQPTATGVPETEEAPAPEPETTQGPEPATESVSQPGRRPSDVSGVTTETTVPGLAVPGSAPDAAPGSTAMAPTPLPQTGEAVAGLTAPEGQGAPAISVQPGSPAPQASAPAPTLSAPQSDIGVSVSTEPAQPPVPVVPEVQTALVPDAAPEAAAPPEEPSQSGQTAPEAETPAVDTAPQKPPVRRLVPDTPDADRTGTTDTAALSRPAIGTPATSLVDGSGSNSSRLPSISDPSAAAETAETSEADEPQTALKRFAAQVDADPALPRMSIILIDDGTGPLGPDTLDNFPFPVTFALDPAAPGSVERMSAYRAQGFEVAALADLPASATPADVEQLLSGVYAALPETVALIEAPGSELQSNRPNVEQVAAFAADSGHGLVFLPNGLNTAEATARRDNVAAVSVLRDFDGEGQDARTKRRFLDGAAFRARQDGTAVMLGRLTPDTLSALVLWSLQDRASSIAIVPVSDILADTLE